MVQTLIEAPEKFDRESWEQTGRGKLYHSRSGNPIDPAGWCNPIAKAMESQVAIIDDNLAQMETANQ